MRWAYVSPLPPVRSGIADYSAELLPALRSAGTERWPSFELEVFTATGRAEGFSIAELAERHRRQAYDLILYQLGNDASSHGKALRLALEIPGVVVLHEPMVHHLVRDVALQDRGLEGFREELRYAYGATGLAAARRLLTSGSGAQAWRLPLFERLVDRSRGVLVHTAAARRRVLASRPRARVESVPHGLDLGALPRPGAATEAARVEGRRELGLPAEVLVLGTFGFVTSPKRLELLLRVFQTLRPKIPAARLLIAGHVSGDYDLPALLERAGDGVLALGHLPRESFLRAMLATDVAVNLRHPSGGESSATLLQLLALARPVVVSAGAAQDVPAGCCAPVAVDPREEEQLLATLLALADDRELRRSLGKQARRWVEAERTVEDSARAYVDVLAAILEPRPMEEPQEELESLPPLARPRPGDVLPPLLASLGEALVDLGLDESTGTLGDEARQAVATVMMELGIEGPRVSAARSPPPSTHRSRF